MSIQKSFETQASESLPVNRLREEFSRHIAAGQRSKFQPSGGASEELAKLVRGLEQRRQGGALTDSEAGLIRDGDQLLQDIARYNEQIEKAPPTSEMTYDLSQSRQVADSPSEPLVIPNISAEEADRIIAGFNQQFEEKVMAKIRKDQAAIAEPPATYTFEPPPAEIPVAGAPPQGRSLQDYLETMKEPVHTIPFADDDSSFDLSKLVNSSPREHV